MSLTSLFSSNFIMMVKVFWVLSREFLLDDPPKMTSQPQMLLWLSSLVLEILS